MIVCFRWLRNGHTIGGQTRSYLDIAQISSDYHQNTITCEATNIIGSTVAEITLDILCESAIPLIYEPGSPYTAPWRHALPVTEIYQTFKLI